MKQPSSEVVQGVQDADSPTHLPSAQFPVGRVGNSSLIKEVGGRAYLFIVPVKVHCKWQRTPTKGVFPASNLLLKCGSLVCASTDEYFISDKSHRSAVREVPLYPISHVNAREFS